MACEADFGVQEPPRAGDLAAIKQAPVLVEWKETAQA